jgi:hypothetical protein
MARMGRKRKRGKGLPSRVVLSRGWAFYIHPTQKTAAGNPAWIKLARDGDISGMYRTLAQVQAGEAAGTMGALFKKYRAEILPGKAPKTQKMQGKELDRLEAVFGRMDPDGIEPPMIVQYLTERGAPVAANREVALLSHIFTKGIRWQLATKNPCLRSLVERNEEKPRRHKVADIDLMRAWLSARPWMRALMALAYVGGQRKMDTARIRDADFGARGLDLTQGKTGTELLLKWTKGLRWARAFALEVRTAAFGKVKPDMVPWLVCTRRGQVYSARQQRREWARVMLALEQQGGAPFQFRDIRAKSATDHATGEHLGHQDKRILDRHYRLGPREVQPL